MLRILDSTTLIWSDVLHYAYLSTREVDAWDKAAYGRSVMIFGAIVLENTLSNYSGCSSVGYGIRREMDKFCLGNNKPQLDWGSGWAQQILMYFEDRKLIVHRTRFAGLFEIHADSPDAMTTVERLRKILDDMSHYYGKSDRWWHDSQFEEYKTWTSHGHGGLIVDGADVNDCITIGSTWKNKEHIHYYIKKDRDWKPYYDQFMQQLRGPVSSIFVDFVGKRIYEETWLARGV